MKAEKTEIKICGLTSADDARLLNRYGADYAGMVLFYEKSRRNISIGEAENIIHALSPEIKSVAVVVSPDTGQLQAIQQADFDYIQIHGQLAEDVYNEAELPIIRAVNVPNEGLSENWLAECAELAAKEKIAGILFDAGKPGSGKTFDWEQIKNLKSIIQEKGKKLFLAGGLNAENVCDALHAVKPDAVDVSSGVEYRDGDRRGKDPALVENFVRQVRQA